MIGSNLSFCLPQSAQQSGFFGCSDTSIHNSCFGQPRASVSSFPVMTETSISTMTPQFTLLSLVLKHVCSQPHTDQSSVTSILSTDNLGT